MKESKHSRTEVVRDTLVLQVKLIVDGLRDLFLMPIVLFASIAGLIFHKNNPGRYTYRVLSYGKMTEKWIGLFEEAQKDTMDPIELDNKSLDELLQKTQVAFESKYINENKKQKLVQRLNTVLDDINSKVNPEKKA